MPILGIVASSTRQGQAVDTGAMFPIAMVNVGSAGSASVSFTSIPSTYKHLQLRVFARGTQSVANNYFQVQFNGDTASNYYGAHWLKGDGSSVTAGADGAANVIYVERMVGASTAASIFSTNTIDLLDYSSTAKFKTLRNLGGFDSNGAGQVLFTSGLWRSTSAITSISITPSANDFAQYSQFALYGIKG